MLLLADMQPQNSNSPRPTPLQEPLGPTGQSIQKRRRRQSTGGNRVWTEEEEAYLTHSRLHKIPYKRIAAHLQKTELACRLHYHQRSYGSPRRRQRRAESISSSASSCSSVCSTHRPHSAPGPHGPVASDHSAETPTRMPQPVVPNQPTRTVPIPILPRPVSSVLPPIKPASIKWNGVHSHGKNLSLGETKTPVLVLRTENDIDIGRLRGLYDKYRNSFWNSVAAEYSPKQSVTGHELEETFFETMSLSGGAVAPLAPSPGSRHDAKALPSTLLPSTLSRDSRSRFTLGTQKTGEQSAAKKCAVASLLTVERDVWESRDSTTL